MKEAIIKLNSDHIKVKGGEYVRDYQHGKWIWDEQILGLVCSECKELGVERSNFCPYCGADMREVRDE